MLIKQTHDHIFLNRSTKKWGLTLIWDQESKKLAEMTLSRTNSQKLFGIGVRYNVLFILNDRNSKLYISQVIQLNHYYLWINQPCHRSTSKISPHSRATSRTSGCFWVWSRRSYSVSCSASATTKSSITLPLTTPFVLWSCRKRLRMGSGLSWSGSPTCWPPPTSLWSRRTTSPFIRILPPSKLRRCSR